MRRGFTVIEVLIAATIIAGGIAGILQAYALYARSSDSRLFASQAMYLAEEGIEGAQLMRDMSWSGTVGAYATSTPYFMTGQNGAVSFDTTSDALIDGQFYRAVTFAPVARGGNDAIAPSGADDPDTRLVRADVSWFDHARNATSTVTLQAYVQNLFKN